MADTEMSRVRVAMAENMGSPVLAARFAASIGWKQGEDIKRIERERQWQYEDLEQAKKDVEETTWDAISAGWLTANYQSKMAFNSFLGDALKIGANIYDSYSKQSAATNTTPTTTAPSVTGALPSPMATVALTMTKSWAATGAASAVARTTAAAVAARRVARLI